MEHTDPRQSGPARKLVALGTGVSLGSVVLSGYAFVQRVPTGLVSDQLQPVAQLLGGSLALVVATAVALIALGVLTVVGRAAPRHAVSLLVATAALTAYAYLGSMPDERAALLNGPGTRPVVDLARVSWALLAVASLLLVAAAVVFADRAPVPARPAVRSLAAARTALGLVLAVQSGFAVVTLTSAGTPRITVAARIDVPAIPRTVDGPVTYTLTTQVADWIVPAGPGFVLHDDDAVVGYDGATGTPRWRFPFSLLPPQCWPSTLRSTGTADDAVLIVACRKPAASALGWHSFLVGLDAVTGRLLWSNDLNWNLQSRLLLSPAAIPVARPAEIGALDPRTGTVRWAHPFSGPRHCSYDHAVTAVERSFVYTAACGTLYVVNAETGAEQTIDLPRPPGTPPDAVVMAIPVAGYGDTVMIKAHVYRGSANRLLAVDTGSGDVRAIPDTDHVNSLNDRSRAAGHYPGPVLRIDDRRLYQIADRRVVHTAPLSPFPAAVPSEQQWALVGDAMVTATADGPDHTRLLVSVSRDGSTTQRPSPCGRDEGGVVAVPGAVLLVCARSTGPGDAPSYDVLGLG